MISLGLYFNLDSLSYFLDDEEVSAYYVNDSDFFFFLRKDIVDKLLESENGILWLRLEENRTVMGTVPKDIEQPQKRYSHIVSDCIYPNN